MKFKLNKSITTQKITDKIYNTAPSDISPEQYIQLINLLYSDVSVWIKSEKKFIVTDTFDPFNFLMRYNLQIIALPSEQTRLDKTFTDNNVMHIATRLTALHGITKTKYPESFIDCVMGKIYHHLVTSSFDYITVNEWVSIITKRPYLWLLVIIQDILKLT